MKEIPVTVKRSIELLGLFLAGVIIVVGKVIIMPLLLSLFLSLMLLPVFRFFRKLKTPEPIAILLPILMLTIFAGLILWLFSSQVGNLLQDLPQIEKNLARHLQLFSNWISSRFGFAPDQQVKLINKQSAVLFSSAGNLLRGAAGSVSGVLFFFIVLPVYIFMTLLYRNIFLQFTLLCFPASEHSNVEDIIRQTEKMVKSYLTGLLIQVCYLTLLIWLLLLMFGIRQALLIGIIFALLNLIPYLGALVSNFLAIVITLASSQNIVDIIIVISVIGFVQFLDNNILMPRIVGYKVKLNAFVSIVGIIAAGALAGIPAMFLALPVIAVLKIVFDRSVAFKKWGILLGDERPGTKMPAAMRFRLKAGKSRAK